MTPVRTLLLSTLFLVVLLAAFLWLYPHMPARVPTHWNAQGQINGYMSPQWAVGTPMIIIAAVAVFTVLLPAVSPRGYGIGPFVAVYSIVMLAVQVVVLVVALGVLLNAAGYAVRMPMLSMITMGALFMVMGNYMGKLRKNFFIGIRTPWTLASDAVWERTHRMGGWLFMLAGLVLLATAFAGGSVTLLVVVIAAVLLIPTVYSYVSYRRIEKKNS